MSKLSFVTARAVSFSFSTGENLFSNLTLSLTEGRYALVGPNGVGKSTFARLLAGGLQPTQGEILASHPVRYLEQIEARPELLVLEYLYEVWESPFYDAELFQRLLGSLPLEKPLAVLSGGEWMRLRIFKAVCETESFLVLDEPTNNLDSSSRELIYQWVKNSKRGLLIISHDRELLELVDSTFELSSQGLTHYGGNYSFYLAEREREQSLAQHELERLRRDKKKTEREAHEKLKQQEKRIRRGNILGKSGSIPRIAVGFFKDAAQGTQARIYRNEEKRIRTAKENFSEAFQNTKTESQLRIELPDTQIAQGKLILELQAFNFRYPQEKDFLWREPLTQSMKGPKRWAITGDNGTGKSTLLRLLISPFRVEGYRQGAAELKEIPSAYFDQEFNILNPQKSVLENVAESSDIDLVELRNRLAQFQITKDKVNLKVEDLSGGERFKVALAKLLLASPAPQLLVLDEPTNNLDISSIEVLEAALRAYQGAILVVSHDKRFLENIGAEPVINLKRV